MLSRRLPHSNAGRRIPPGRPDTRAIAGGVLLCGLMALGGPAASAATGAGVYIAAADGVGAGDAGADSGEAAGAPGYPWPWPVAGARSVVDPFRAPAHEYSPGHRGMDIVAGLGTEVRAPAGGVVAFRGTVVDRPLLTLDLGSGYIITFAPMESSLSPGDAVESGAVIGTVAVGGHAVRGTMHVGVRITGDYVNPRPLFGEVPRAVLLPCCE